MNILLVYNNFLVTIDFCRTLPRPESSINKKLPYWYFKLCIIVSISPCLSSFSISLHTSLVSLGSETSNANCKIMCYSPNRSAGLRGFASLSAYGMWSSRGVQHLCCFLCNIFHLFPCPGNVHWVEEVVRR